MKLGGWNRELRLRIRPWLGSWEFAEQESLCFVRNKGDHTEMLRFGGRVEGVAFKFSCFVGIRFEAVSRLVNPDEPGGITATIANPIHLLSPDRKFYEWVATDGEEINFPMPAVIRDVEGYAFPFFEKYGLLENVEAELRVPTHHSPFLINRWQRVILLSAILFARGDRGAAERALLGPSSSQHEFSERDLAKISEFRDRIMRD